MRILPGSEQGSLHGAAANRPDPRELLLQHERRSVGHARRSGDLCDDASILPTPYQAHRAQPQMERELRAFQQRRHRDGELTSARIALVKALAMGGAMKSGRIPRAAEWAFRPVGPPELLKKRSGFVMAIIYDLRLVLGETEISTPAGESDLLCLREKSAFFCDTQFTKIYSKSFLQLCFRGTSKVRKRILIWLIDNPDSSTTNMSVRSDGFKVAT
jgi:hypothetical protein